MTIRKLHQKLEGRMSAELSDIRLTEREVLIIRTCAVVALQAVVEERQEFHRDLECIRKGIDEAHVISSAVSRLLQR